MASLPTVGASNNTWGTELNTFLGIAHDTDGSLFNIEQSSGDTDTYIDLGDDAADKILLVAGNETMITCLEDAQDYVKIGDDGDIDFVVGDNWLFVEGSSGRVGIGIAASLAGLCHIDQSSLTGAIPALLLDQADISEEFIRFIGSAASAVLTQSIIDDDDVNTPTLQAWLKVYVQDDGNQITDQAYFIPISTLA